MLASGAWLNAQFSLIHVLSLLGLRLPPAGWNTAFLLTVGIPLLVVLCGNIYCGYLCPFGALQELLALLRPPAWRSDPTNKAWRWGRLAKYILLAAVIILFATRLDTGLASPDVLATAFARSRTAPAAVWFAVLLAPAFVWGRFWCRTLCPAGAFLALISRLRLLRRLVPGINYRRCVYGVTGADDLDCICCDRCRMPMLDGRKSPHRRPARQYRNSLLFLVSAAALGLCLFIRMAATSKQAGALPAGEFMRATPDAQRQVDMPRLRAIIRQGLLSDREAMHYSPVADQVDRRE
jgi:hypothetical protein